MLARVVYTCASRSEFEIVNGIALILRGSFLIKAINFVNGTDIQNAIFESGLLIQLFVCIIISMNFPYF